MSKFFMQHVGEELAQRDFPRSLGSNGHFCQFNVGDLKKMADRPLHVDDDFLRSMNSFQVWGFPTGAGSYVNQMMGGDFLMLLGSAHTCEYIGSIKYRIERPAPEISVRLWGEAKFPRIILLSESQFIDLEWSKFKEKVGYDRNYELRGKTSRVSEHKLRSSGLSASILANWVRSH